MSIQWTLVAGILYFEIALVTLLLVPFLRPRTWQKFFKSRFLSSIENQANLYFMVFIVILVLLFLDSIREMRKYSGDLESDYHASRHVDAELQHSMKLFRAQRNFYIAGFALFLFLVIRRLVTLITSLAQLDMQAEVSMKMAKGAADAAKSLIGEKGLGDSKSKTDGESAAKIKNLEIELKAVRAELAKAKKDNEAITQQAKGITTEYDRLLQECSKQQKSSKAGGETKKDA